MPYPKDDNTQYRVAVPSAPVFIAPNVLAELDTQILFGESVLIMQKHGTWTKVRSQVDGKEGFIKQQLLECKHQAVTDRVSVARAAVYPAPDSMRFPFSHLPLNARVSVMSTKLTNEGWWNRISWPRATREAWMFGDQLMPLGVYASDWVAECEKLSGTPYIWGARDPCVGIDCSGLIQAGRIAIGKPCERDSGRQFLTLGEDLEVYDTFRDLRRGDLVFWQGHVAVMVNDVHCLHAAFARPYRRVVVQDVEQARQERRSAGKGEIRGFKRILD